MDIQENTENIRNLILTHKKPSHQTTNKKEVSVDAHIAGIQNQINPQHICTLK